MHQFSYYVAIAFTLNYIVGTGFLTLPWAFMKVGGLFSICLLAAVSVFSICSALFILEALARLPSLATAKETKTGYGAISTLESGPVPMAEDTKLTNTSDSLPQVETGHVPEMTELCEIYFGPMGRKLYMVCILLYFYGTLSVYSSVFAHCLVSVYGESDLGGESWAYAGGLFLFSLVVVPLTCMELTEQITVQVTLTLCRVLMLSIMSITILLSYFCHCPVFDDYPDLPEHAEGTATAFHPSNLYLLLPIIAYANVFHHSLPVLAAPVRDKTELGSIFTTTLIICVCSYAVIGLLVSNYFGSYTQPTANINWSSYTAGIDKSETFLEYVQLSLVFFCRWFVVMFPALDVASAFPLNAITLGNALLSTFGGQPDRREREAAVQENSESLGGTTNILHSGETDGDIAMGHMESRTSREGGYSAVESDTPVSDEAAEIEREAKFTRTFYRVLAAFPPILLALFCHHVEQITAYTGVTGFLICFIFPPLLALESKSRMLTRALSGNTLYSSVYLTSDAAAYACLSVGTFFVVYVVSILAWQQLSG